MADGYSRASGKVGVAMATAGPGATNMVTGLATAMLDSSPIICITGQVPKSVIGTDAFQEVDVTGITLPITKHNYLVTDINELSKTIFDNWDYSDTITELLVNIRTYATFNKIDLEGKDGVETSE